MIASAAVGCKRLPEELARAALADLLGTPDAETARRSQASRTGKRVAHAAMEVFLLLNGWELVGTLDEQERLMLDLAAGQITREQLTDWLEQHIKPIAGTSAG